MITIAFIQKKNPSGFSIDSMAGVLGFEPRKCQIQSLMPYHLAIPQSQTILYIFFKKE